MIKLFRNIRQKMLTENKLRKYFFYAIGEIILVVIGILIALQVNNWNSKNVEQKEITSYYKRIEQEAQLVIKQITRLKSKLTENYQINKRSLEILGMNNRDSLHLLANTIGTLGANHTTNLSTPIIEEFFEKGLLSKIKNDSIKASLQSFKIASKSLNRYDIFIDNQYVTAIEPFFYNRINYSEVTGNRRKMLINSGPKTNYQQFYNDMTIWNLISFKIETIEVHQDRLDSFLILLRKMVQQLKVELND